LSKSLSPFADVGAAVLNGNGTLLVSWFTNTSVRPPGMRRSEIPSGIASNRILPGSESPTVRSGVTVTPGLTGVSIDGRLVMKPPGAPTAVADVSDAMSATARTVQAKIARLLIHPPSGIVDGQV
jgi:hypothetical protein